MRFNATFSSISAISWRSVLVAEEAGGNRRSWAGNEISDENWKFCKFDEKRAI